MKALLLAAGLGTRLRPITDVIPKCLVPIHGKPLLGYWLDILASPVIDKIFINTHYFEDQVIEFIEHAESSKEIIFLREPELLGTGGTILNNASLFEGEALFVAHADNLSIFDIETMIKNHANRPVGVEITMMTFETDQPLSCGIVNVNEHGLITQFYEKYPVSMGTRANGAVYIFEPGVIEFIKNLGATKLDISVDVIPRYLGRMQEYFNADFHRDIGSIESLKVAEEEYPGRQ